MTSRSTHKAWHADLALAVNALIWGATFVVVKEALSEISTLLFLALRFSLAALALMLAFRRRAAPAGGWLRGLLGGCVAGAVLFAGYLFQTVGLKFTTAPKSAFLTGIAIVLVPFFSAAVYRRRPHIVEVIGALITLTGMGLMMLPSGGLRINPGDLLTLVCAVAFAAHILVVGHYSRRVSYESIAVLQVATAALMGLGSFWWVERPMVHWSFPVISAIIITGLLATALAFTIQAWAQQYTTPTRTALIFALEPVFAWLTSFLLEGERLTLRASFGALLILSGILFVELKPKELQRHP